MLNRRSLLSVLSRMPLIGLAANSNLRAAMLENTNSHHGAGVYARDVYKELGVPTFINAGEPFTSLSGGPIRAEVKEAMAIAEKSYVRLMDVQNAVGQRLATLLGAGGAMITAGAASGLTLGTAACLTGSDPAKIRQLPDLTGMAKEVIIQKAHRYDYEHAVRNCGVTMVEVETSDQMVNAIGPNTVCLLFNNRWNANGKIQHDDFIKIAKTHSVPSFNDCASDVPPAENLTKFVKMGFDLVTFSGGKNLQAPSSTGLLIGRKDLIEAAKLNHEPEDDVIGRGMKVNKEEMIGLMVAIELCLKESPSPIFVKSEMRLKQIAASLSAIHGVTVEMFEPPVSYKIPHLRILWDETGNRPSADKVRQLLRSGQPSIVTRTGPDPVKGLEITAWMLSTREIPIVIERIRSLLA